MRIAFFGLPLAALLLAGDGHEIVFAGICRRGALGTRRLTKRIGPDRVAMTPDVTSDAALARVVLGRPDLLVSWFWTTRLPQRILDVPRLGAFGVHPSLLPRFRGPDPYFWAIDMGDTETGVTAHRLEATYDTGAILGQQTLAIAPAWNAWELARKLDRPSLALLREVTRSFADGRAPADVAQDESRATAAPAPDEDLLVLRWSWPAERIVRRMRAASPWPGALVQIGETEITLTRAEVTAEVPRALLPGEAAVRDGRAVVRASDLGVLLLEGRDENDRQLDRHALAALVNAAQNER